MTDKKFQCQYMCVPVKGSNPRAVRQCKHMMNNDDYEYCTQHDKYYDDDYDDDGDQSLYGDGEDQISFDSAMYRN